MPPPVNTEELKKMFGPLIGQLPQCEVDLNREEFIKQFQDLANALDKGEYNKKPINSVFIISWSRVIAHWPKNYKYFELDTNISVKNLARIYKILQEIAKANMAMDMTDGSKNTKAFEHFKKNYNDNIDLYIKTIKRLEKPDKKTVEQLHIQKIKEHRQYQEYIRKLQKQGDDNSDSGN
jgi:hypothetical protein